MNLYLKQCTISDAEMLQEISFVTYKDTFGPTNSDAIMAAYLKEAYDLLKLKGELANPASTFYFLYDQEVLVAYMKINLPKAQSDLHEPESLELERLYVKKEHKGQGYGKYLMGKVTSMAEEEGFSHIWLGVWEHNQPALNFYEKMGFIKTSQHDFHMGDEVQTDFILKKLIE